jgi:hypothetical protein
MKTQSKKSGAVLRESEFDAQWTHVQDQCKAIATEARGKQDQMRAEFLAKSGWTQQKIADHIGKAKSWVCQMLTFGAFLNHVFTTGEHNLAIPKNLTESKFREYWSQTHGPSNECRFDKVLEAMEADLILAKTVDRKAAEATAKAITDAFADGKYRTLEQIAKKAGRRLEEIKPIVERMKATGSYNTCVQVREFEGEVSYKIRRGTGKKVQLDVVLLEAEGKKDHMAAYCPSTVLDIAHRIRKLLQERST